MIVVWLTLYMGQKPPKIWWRNKWTAPNGNLLCSAHMMAMDGPHITDIHSVTNKMSDGMCLSVIWHFF